MNVDGTQLARVMMSIHEAEMEQAARHPGCLLSDRIERSIVLHRRGNRTLYGLGGLLVRAGRRLQEYGMPRPLPLGGKAAQNG
jgi:hypothetical protein